MNGSLTFQHIAVGALAGATTALLCLGVASGSMLGALLYMLSPVPLMIAGLGFGLKSALSGAFAAIAISLVMANGSTAMLVALAIAAPACAASYWLNLARPAEEIGGPAGKLAWFPLADVLFSISLLTGIAFVTIGVRIGFGPELASELAREMATLFTETNPEFRPTHEGMASLQRFIEVAIPVALPMFWTMTLTASLYIALAVAQRSGLTRRPKDDWPAGLRMPRVSVFALVAAIMIGFASGWLGSIASAFVGALAAGFIMAGFALLHERTRGNPARLPILVLAYLCVFFMLPVIIFMLIAGIATTGRHVLLSPAASPRNDKQTEND